MVKFNSLHSFTGFGTTITVVPPLTDATKIVISALNCLAFLLPSGQNSEIGKQQSIPPFDHFPHFALRICLMHR